MERLDLDAPLACSLNDNDFRDRRQFARRKLLPMISEWERVQDGLIYWLNLKAGDEADIQADLKAFIQFEQQCCGFLKFEILWPADGDQNKLGLKIEGPREASKTLEIFAQAVKSAGINQNTRP